MKYENLEIQNNEGIVTMLLNRPKSLNAINSALMEDLNHYFSTNKNDLSISGVVMTGAGEKAFAAGADITQFLSLDSDSAAQLSKYGQETFDLIEQFHAPVIAAVNGFALGGGCELAMACHMRIAEEQARFGQPEVNLGLITGFDGSQRLPHIVGKPKAMELLLTGDMISAGEALKIGLVNHIAETGKSVEKSLEILSKIKSKGPLAIKAMIECVNASDNESQEGSIMEHKYFGSTMVTEDCREGVTAFLEKRKANFKGA